MVEKHCTHLLSEKFRSELKRLTEISRNNDWFFCENTPFPTTPKNEKYLYSSTN